MIRIVIAEDQEMLLAAMGSLLDLEEDMKVVGQASNGEEALTLVHQLQPDVCLMDIEMPRMSGLDAAEVLKSAGCKVIILTTFARNGYLARALTADISGYLLKDSPSEELACSIRSIMSGKRIYSPELVDAGFNPDVLQVWDDGQFTSSPDNKIGAVRKYFSSILEKMRQPTG
ncbi:MAG: response regulator transcription factor [Bacillus sp. (in: firmicutes)]